MICWANPVNTPVSLTVTLITSVQTDINFQDGYITSALSDFGGTLSFATDRPVFDLPVGYSANSVEAGVVGNRFISAMPEPASGAMAALGLLIVGSFARRRRRTVAAAVTVLPLLSATPSQAQAQVDGRAYLPSGSSHATRWTDGIA